jgi:hypothetical protein
MKRKEKSSIFDTLQHQFPTVRLHRSDLQEIIDISKASGFDIRISDDDYEYETLDEVREQRGDRVLRLILTMHLDKSICGTLFVKIEKDGVVVCSQKDDKLVPLWHKIKDLIANRVPWYARLMSPFVWAVVAITWLWNSPKRDEFSTLPPIILIVWFAVLLFSLGMSIFSFWYKRTNGGVYLQREYEVLGFWDRYGEKIVMIALGTLLGVLGKIATDYITGK